MNTLKSMHFTDNYLINPTNPITVNLIGAGGTGSRMLTELARMNHSLIALGHTGLQVCLYDDDSITPANQGRQLFADTELGLYKSVALINRTNRFFGTSWKAVSEQFNTSNLKTFPNNGRANIYISCVDTISARFEIAQILEGFKNTDGYQRSKPLYWLDIGNSQNTGQALLATIGNIKQPASKLYNTVSDLPMITEEFQELLQGQNENNEPSCSLAEALEKQDLFINSTLASMGASLLWKLFREGMTQQRGFFLNLATFRSEPIKAG
ncbi:PRTRC genetic system ThiF family protein [Flavobacterium sp. 90]|uniref:PRTRC system ThiF family protein n=1 Tax=unclassified Flavobacterium TaxID=196869 RepID=UPI000EB41DFD|nr:MULTISPECIES: PRTRC system ThiF family protein [unclassified Flavobacterium]RKR05128.1 PRTRC genetic system ThiF family protein [Flavobacterium sp. 81]TCK56443.1 PRTRC genetic system ThiF family protein [Flavobacterium sp. 90]